MKATSSFKLSKPTKSMMATIINPQQRADYKRMMIEAELAASVKPSRREKADRSDNNE